MDTAQEYAAKYGGYMTDREVMQQALGALESSRVFVTSREKIKHPEGTEWYDKRIEALRAALAQPEPAPVAWRSPNWSHSDADYIYRDLDDPALTSDGKVSPHNEPLYTVPPQREWVGLTHEEYEAMAEQCVTNCYFDTLEYAKSIEAKLKEKNT